MITLFLALDTVALATAVAAATVAASGIPQNGVTPDLTARRFVTSCAGCHTLGGGKLTGPDLVGVGAWPVADLKGAIQRMQKHVGPLSDADVQQLVDLLRDPQVRPRLKSEEARVAQSFAAKMEPPSAFQGKALFLGEKPLRNGGAPCLACHQAEGGGGSLGPNLGGVRARMGEVALASAIEKSGFKVMEPAYRLHPVARQEALDLARYLSSLDPSVASPVDAPLLLWGGVGAAALMAGIAVFQRNHAAPHPARLQRRRK